MSGANRRVVAYDMLRVFAIASVVAIHTLMVYRQLLPAGSPARVLDDILHYAVPLFLFMSGALLWSRPPCDDLRRELGSLARRVRTVLLPYLAWFALYLALYLYDSGDSTALLRRLPLLLLTGRVWYHLYFIPMLIAFYLLTPIATRVMQRSPELLVAVAYAVRILAGGWIVESLEAGGGELVAALPYYVVWHLPHMALGGWFAVRVPLDQVHVRRVWPPLLVAGLGVLAAESALLISLDSSTDTFQRFAYAAAMASTVLGLALAAFDFEPLYERWRRPLHHAATAAFGIYFVHPLFVWANQRVLDATGRTDLWFEWWFAPIVFIAITAASFWFATLCARHPRTAWLVGAPKPYVVNATPESGRPGTGSDAEGPTNPEG